jgi:lysophospholipase L1-like esterase
MRNRFVAVFVLAFLLVASLHVGMASAQSVPKPDPILQGLWAGANFDLSSLHGQPRPAPNTPAPNPQLYVALGDSVAAGAGLPVAIAANPGDVRCARSPQAYPTKIAAATGKNLLHIACSGAKAGDLFTRQGIHGTSRAPQLKTAFASGTPGLITITAGANDAHWVSFIKKCYATSCGSNSDTRIADVYLKILKVKLNIVLLDIERRSTGNPPQVVLTGYYDPLSPACAAVQTRFTTQEIAWLSNRLALLNQTIETVGSHYTFATFAPVSFAGHDICSASPWVQGQNDPAPFHPTVQGQEVIANTVLKAL